MSITQQYLLDTYRARQHGDPTPPPPAPTTGRPCANWPTTAGSARP